jgi:predicted nucleic acid-binding protein
MDEKKGRKIAGDVYGLPVIGTAGLLILAKRAGLINEAVPLLVSMRKNGYWIDEEILGFVMQEANE